MRKINLFNKSRELKTMNKFRNFFRSEAGSNTVEILIITAVLIGIALIFKDKINDLMTNLIMPMFGE